MNKDKVIKLIFPILVLAILLFCFAYACVGKMEINTYENRGANKLPLFSIQSYLDGSFQSAMEDGLGDQLPFALAAKKAYNNISFKLSMNSLRSIHKLIGGADTEIQNKELNEAGVAKYLPKNLNLIGNEGAIAITELTNFGDNKYNNLYNDTFSFNGHMLLKPYEFPENLASVGTTKMIKGISENYPDLSVYAFYIEREMDIDFISGEKVGFFDEFKKQTGLFKNHISACEIYDFNTFDQLFFKTDHHWNHKGMYAGYRGILDMLQPSATPLVPEAEYLLGSGNGSRSVYDASGYYERFYGYKISYPEMSYTLNGEKSNEFGLEQSIIKEVAETGEYKWGLYYDLLYGKDYGEIIIENKEKPGTGNILVFRDSFGKAILKNLAAHYDMLYSVDLRHYEDEMGKAFDFNSYIKENGITTVLFITQSGTLQDEECEFGY